MSINKFFILAFSLSLLISCKKEEPIKEPVQVSTPKDPYKDYFIEHKTNGAIHSFFNSDLHIEVSSYSYPSIIDSVEYFNLIESKAEMISNTNGNEGCKISFGNFKEIQSIYSANKKQAISTICSLGSHPFDYDPQQLTTYINIEAYYNSELYISYLGTQPETSSFNITESTEMLGSQASQIVKGTYSCRLYKQSNQSEFIDVTDGKFYLFFSTP